MGEKVQIVHDQPGCIGCEACVAVHPDRWEMHGDKSHVIGSALQGTNEVLDIEDSELSKNMEAARACPVNVIHLKDKSGKLLI